MSEPTYLTTFELLHHTGLWKILSIIWFPLILTLMGLYVNKKISGGK